jgi:ABC-type dipeptide/oligopeptide/nickel transport system permease component
MPAQPPLRKPVWYGVVFRVVFVTLLLTLLAFSLSLLLGIVGTVLVAKTRHVAPDMRIAYRVIAVPVAMVVCAIVFVLSLRMEIRHYRQSEVLSEMERRGWNGNSE